MGPKKKTKDTPEVERSMNDVECSRYHLDSPFQWLLGFWSKLMLLLGWTANQASIASDTPSGNDTRQTERRKWKLDPNAQWEIFASYDGGEDAGGDFINWVDHSPDLTEKEAREVIEEFFLDPDFLGFQPEAEEFPAVSSNEDIERLVEAIYWRISQNEKRQR